MIIQTRMLIHYCRIKEFDSSSAKNCLKFLQVIRSPKIEPPSVALTVLTQSGERTMNSFRHML